MFPESYRLAWRRTFVLGSCPLISAREGRRGTAPVADGGFLLAIPSILWSVAAVKMQIASHVSIMRKAGNVIPALHPVILVIACFFLPFTAPVAWAEVADDFRIWGNVTARGNFGFVDPELKRWRWWMEVQPRARESGSEMDQLLIRPGIGYALTDRSILWIGYAHVTNYPVVGETIQENRIWQQHTWSGPTPLGAFASRTRFEQRWQENGDDTGGRFRQMFRFSWPFSFHPAASFVVVDEVFVHLNTTDWGARQGFDQNRGFAGLGYRWHPSILTEIGYLNQYINTTNTDLMNHILSINVFLDL